MNAAFARRASGLCGCAPWPGWGKWPTVATSMSSSVTEGPIAGESRLYLIDTPGLFRILQGELRKAWSDHLAAGVIAMCPTVELEFLFSARSLADRLEKRQLMHDLFGWVPISERGYERAPEVRQMLTDGGMHRPAGPVDLLIAATAERERLTVPCDDRDFREIARMTGQPAKLVADI